MPGKADLLFREKMSAVSILLIVGLLILMACAMFGSVSDDDRSSRSGPGYRSGQTHSDQRGQQGGRAM
jgi:hypothetical protein